jgi:uncharacterized protein (TIGR03067 family)
MTPRSRTIYVLVFVFALVATAIYAHAAQPQNDYQRLSGEWQLTGAVINGKRVPESQVKRTVLVTSGNTFRFPHASGVATHIAGKFTLNPHTIPKQVDSVAIGGKNAGQVTLGIYEIIDSTHQRECWGAPGGARPTAFIAPRGSRWVLQYWKKVK